MFKNFQSRIQSDSGVANTIEMLFIFFLMFAMLSTILDIGMYFLNRNVVVNAAQSGARNAAVLGGVNSELANDYGVTLNNMRNGQGGVNVRVSPGQVADQCAGMGITDGISCLVLSDLMNSSAQSISIQDVECGPQRTGNIGDRTFCTVTFRYTGIPGSALSAFQITNKDQVVTMTAESEVIQQ